MSLGNTKEEWDDLARLNHLWAILTDPNKKYKDWDVDIFFKTGENEINDLFKKIQEFGIPIEFKKSLDFGCGVGRITRNLSKKFEKCYGVDISDEMILLAKKYNQHIENCIFVVNNKDNLSQFNENCFDMIYSNLVLQHIQNKKIIKSYIIEFLRTLKPNGLLIFQLPSNIHPIHRIQITKKLFKLLVKIGLKKEFIFHKLGLYPMTMNFVSEDEIRNLLIENQGKILKIEHNLLAGKNNESRTYFISK